MSDMDADLELIEEVTRLRRDLAIARAEADIKGEFLSSRQCADHSGKWERGRCLQCELEAARKDAERLRNAATLAQLELLALMVDRVISRSAALGALNAAMRQEEERRG